VADSGRLLSCRNANRRAVQCQWIVHKSGDLDRLLAVDLTVGAGDDDSCDADMLHRIAIFAYARSAMRLELSYSHSCGHGRISVDFGRVGEGICRLETLSLPKNSQFA